MMVAVVLASEKNRGGFKRYSPYPSDYAYVSIISSTFFYYLLRNLNIGL